MPKLWNYFKIPIDSILRSISFDQCYTDKEVDDKMLLQDLEFDAQLQLQLVIQNVEMAS